MKYDYFSMLPERAFQPRNGRTGMTLEGGGGGGPTSSTVTQSNIPDWLRPQTEALLGAATQEYFQTEFDPTTGAYNIVGTKPYTPYSADPRDYVAQFSPQQQQVFAEAAGMETPEGFEQGAGLTTMSAIRAMTPTSYQAYMSPYMQDVVNIQKRAAIEDAQKAQLGTNLGAARSGTYGGARQVLAQTQREAGLQQNLSDIQAKGLQSAYEQARQAQQFGITTGMQAGSQLANIASGQQQADLARLGFQGQMGDIQQQQQQAIINQAIQDYALSQEMPMQRLAGYNALLRGYATPTTTVSQYQAQPSGLQQLAGLGTTAAGIGTIAGMGRKEGGVIKLAKGGITDTDAIESFAEDLSIPQLQQSMRSGELKGKEYIGMPILQNKVVDAERMKMAQSMMGQQQGQQQSISDALMAKADQLQGAQPVMAAGGGIVAFEKGGVARFQNQGLVGTFSGFNQDYVEDEDEFSGYRPTFPSLGEGNRRYALKQLGYSNEQIRQMPVAQQEFVIQNASKTKAPTTPTGGITDVATPTPTPAPAPASASTPTRATSPAMPQQGTPEGPKKDMATLLAEREAQQKAFLGEDPSIKKMRESLAKQGEDTLLDRILRGSQMVFAGEQLRTRGDTAGLEKVIAGEAKRAETAAEREAKLAELEGADYRRRADIYKEVAGEERKKAETKEERAFQEKLVRLRSSLEPRDFNNRLLDMAQGKSGSKSDQEFARKLLEGKTRSTALTYEDAAKIVDDRLKNQFTLVSDIQKAEQAAGRPVPDAQTIRRRLIEEEMAAGGARVGNFAGFSSRQLGS